MNEAEAPLIFACKGDSLVGVLTRPESPRDVGVVVIVGGPQYRVGSHRQFVHLARACAAAGFATLRFDVRGMGDSTGEPRGFDDIDEDIAAAVDCLQAAVPEVRRVLLWGLCDAASAALLYVNRVADDRVHALCLLNPWVRTPASLESSRLLHYYLPRVLETGFWRKLLSGRIDASALLELGSSVRARLGRQRTGSAEFRDGMMSGLRAFAGPIQLILSGNDLTASEFADVTRRDASWTAALRRGSVTTRHLENADHTFSSSECRLQVESWTVDWSTRLLAIPSNRSGSHENRMRGVCEE